jgi:hypothetical protein
MKKIIIVGSGSNKKIIPKKKNYYISCNSSILRFSKIKPQCLAISESIIGNKKKIFNSKINIINLDKFASNIIRKNKINVLKRAKCETLLVYSNSTKKEIERRILELEIKYKSLIILSHRKILYKIINLLDFKKLKPIFKKLGFLKILKLLITGNLQKGIKPSLGVAALLWANAKYNNTNIHLDGIGYGDRVHYPSDGRLKNFKFNLEHREIDELIISSI